MKKLLVILLTISPLIVEAAPKKYLIAECLTSMNSNIKIQAELEFEGKLSSNGRPSDIDFMELELVTYDRKDSSSPWIRSKDFVLYPVTDDEERIADQFFMEKRLTLQNVIATNDSSWNMDYNSGSMGLKVPNVFTVLNSTPSTSPGTHNLIIRMATFGKKEDVLARQSFMCQQYRPSGKPF